MHKFAEFVADGDVKAEFVLVESEHSAMSASVGAAAGGVRAITATSANGLALMWEIVYIAASYRLPIVMPVINRALSGPINIHCDHSDVMGMRDSGWIIIFSESGQEAYDNMIQAVRIGERLDDAMRARVVDRDRPDHRDAEDLGLGDIHQGRERIAVGVGRPALDTICEILSGHLLRDVEGEVEVEGQGREERHLAGRQVERVDRARRALLLDPRRASMGIALRQTRPAGILYPNVRERLGER